ncbi:MAG: phosphatase PAP2 family protein [Elusimicrobiota bacterium]
MNNNNAQTLKHSNTHRLIYPMDILIIGYYLIISLILIFSRAGISEYWPYLLSHIIIIAFVFLIAKIYSKNKYGIIYLARHMYPIILLIYTYKELNYLIPIVSPKMMDAYIYNFELSVLGFHPTILLEKIVSRPLTELLTLAYFSYYSMIFLPPLILCFQKRFDELNDFIETILIAYSICYFVFLLFPVHGPRFEFKDIYTIQLKGYFITYIQAFLMEYGETLGACMPSSHVAAACVSLIMVKRYFKSFFPIMLFAVILMSIATFYNRYHYVSDVFAGIIVCVIAVYLKPFYLKILSKHGYSDKF